MRIPAEIVLRQDEMRRAAAARRECSEVELAGGKTLTDDCAEILLAWWKRKSKHSRITLQEIEMVARRMRELGKGATS